MKKLFSLILIISMVFAMSAQVFAVVPINPVDPSLVMYATASTEGAVVGVSVSPYDSGIHGHKERLDPTNAYGAFDAVSTMGINEHFFGVASRTSVNFTFEDKFYNIADLDMAGNVIDPQIADIKLREVTWGALTTWHAEGTLVFLTGAVVKGAGGSAEAYVPTAQEGSYGYFAGIAGNKEAILGFTSEQKAALYAEYAAMYGVTGRAFHEDTVYMDPDGVRATTYFHMPDEVIYAEGITLVDITEYLHDYGANAGQVGYPNGAVGNPSTYTSGAGKLLTFTGRTAPFAADTIMNDSIEATVEDGIGNTDGFDLDAIAVYKYIPVGISDDSATGLGDRILSKGTWFMYNYYDGSNDTFEIQAGNPKNGLNIIGSYTVVNNGDGTYTVNYSMNPTIAMGGYLYDIVVMDEHLAISDDMNFTASPGTDVKNYGKEYGVPFADDDGEFYIFAHFAVEYQ